MERSDGRARSPASSRESARSSPPHPLPRGLSTGRAGRPRLDRLARRQALGRFRSACEPARPWFETTAGPAFWSTPQKPIALTVRETWDPGWKALLDGKPVKIQRKSAVFLNIDIPSGQHELILKYDPVEVRIGHGGLILLVWFS